jgi:hypothetical protein
MKKLISLSLILLAFIFIASCRDNEFDNNKANALCEKAIKLIHEKNYTELSKLYTDDFKTSESPEVRAEHFDKIIEVTGGMKSDSLISTTPKSSDDNDELVMVYKVIAERMTINESFTIAKENGEYRIAQINIQQEQKNN